MPSKHVCIARVIEVQGELVLLIYSSIALEGGKFSRPAIGGINCAAAVFVIEGEDRQPIGLVLCGTSRVYLTPSCTNGTACEGGSLLLKYEITCIAKKEKIANMSFAHVFFVAFMCGARTAL
ncbi:hypothetical protein [Rhizobium laguerreae]|uniref:Uncharacterized protein n=1 Tax=Rhizobium laguerreae TaxID=1076926 RepID=A0A7Y2RC20_9HYPH|nr:hypothetical protein [Rhizobium laguerreae]NNH68214.1 hypothetical protein [Rhizobium laguerreae]